MRTFRVIVRYIGLEADERQGKAPQEMLIEADGMTVIDGNLVFSVDNPSPNAANNTVAVFSFWEYAQEVTQ